MAESQETQQKPLGIRAGLGDNNQINRLWNLVNTDRGDVLDSQKQMAAQALLKYYRDLLPDSGRLSREKIFPKIEKLNNYLAGKGQKAKPVSVEVEKPGRKTDF